MRYVLMAAAALAASCSRGGDVPVCPAREPAWREADNAMGHRAWNSVTVRRDGTAAWNGMSAREATVRRYLGLVRQLTPQPVTVFRREAGTPCDAVERYRGLVERELQCRTSGDCAYGESWLSRDLSGDPGV